jgi:hypothetical protein
MHLLLKYNKKPVDFAVDLRYNNHIQQQTELKMTLQNINFAALSQANQQVIAKFQSPERESSVVKGVPLSMLSEVRNIVRSAANGRNVRVKFRGPRH